MEIVASAPLASRGIMSWIFMSKPGLRPITGAVDPITSAGSQSAATKQEYCIPTRSAMRLGVRSRKDEIGELEGYRISQQMLDPIQV